MLQRTVNFPHVLKKKTIKIKKNLKVNNWTSMAKMQHSKMRCATEVSPISSNSQKIIFQKTLQVRLLGSHNPD